jgi:hypothetical protein
VPLKNRYTQIIEWIFGKYYQEGAKELIFDRNDIIQAAKELEIQLPKNIGDLLYSFRYRTSLPELITNKTQEGYEWAIRPIGRAQYKLVLVAHASIEPSKLLVETKILDATPGIIVKYALSDEQALLAKLRYNRLVDIFTGLTCYSLQSHLRTAVTGVGQIETDEIYIGIDRRGAHFVLPVQAKGGKDKLGIIQIEQDFALCSTKFPQILCRSIAAQFMDDELIALFEFEQTPDGVRVSSERHYRLVHPQSLSSEELDEYRRRSLQ